MALVDYSSSNSASTESLHQEPPVKRRKGDHSSDTSKSTQLSSAAQTTSNNGDKKPLSTMPPLPSTFHDLYASTVRQSVVDDPSLHHGRKRHTPHVVGNWPSHLYVEWHPTNEQHDLLVKLLEEIEEELEGRVKLENFLTSDLGAPLPLHISLSRPLSLTTSNKDAFLDKITETIRNSAVSPFYVAPRGLAWYKSPDSDRVFLIVRVTSENGSTSNDKKEPNPELMTLLTKCNYVAARFDQPSLYQQRASKAKDELSSAGSAFHVSIAWTFDVPGEEPGLRGINVFKRRRYNGMRRWEIDVSAIKAKIGNVVHHIPLKQKGKDRASGDHF